MNSSVLYICYYNISEPLVQTQVIEYLRELAKFGYVIHLMTFEQMSLKTKDLLTFKSSLAKDNIIWHIQWHSTSRSIFVKFYDVCLGILRTLWITSRYSIRLIHARSHIAAFMSLPVKVLSSVRVLFDVRGLIADEYLEAGNWSSHDLIYFLTKYLEKTLFRFSDGFVFLTDTIVREVTNLGGSLENRLNHIEVIPCCVRISSYVSAFSERDSYRKRRGWNDYHVVLYIGKLGTWYMAHEMAYFFSRLQRKSTRVFFQIVTQSDKQIMYSALSNAGISPNYYDIRYVPVHDIPLVASAADAGLSFIRPLYSKRSSSPTKIAEYLAAGLPVVTTPGIGDCDSIILNNKVGVIISEFSNLEYDRVSDDLILLMNNNVRDRCFEVAKKMLSIEFVGGPRYSKLYRKLLN